MRKSIFEIENRLNINKEYERLIDSLFEESSIYYNHQFMDFYSFIDEYVFNLWDNRWQEVIRWTLVKSMMR